MKHIYLMFLGHCPNKIIKPEIPSPGLLIALMPTGDFFFNVLLLLQEEVPTIRESRGYGGMSMVECTLKCVICSRQMMRSTFGVYTWFTFP